MGFIALAQLMVALDATIVNIALPSAYTLAFAGLVLLGGRIADYAGRRRAFLVA